MAKLQGFLRAFQRRVDAMVEDLTELVSVSTPSKDPDAPARGARLPSSSAGRIGDGSPVSSDTGLTGDLGRTGSGVLLG